MYTQGAEIDVANFQHKSLANWHFNLAAGCSHGCLFCYVPSVTKTRVRNLFALNYGLTDPNSAWGDYVFLRLWKENDFLNSLGRAKNTPPEKIKEDGNRAIIYSSTTDPYQTIIHADPERQKALNQHARFLVRRSLELIRDHSTLNVRILTRSPLARQDFDLYKTFGKRLLFGMSLPTSRNDLSKTYEPNAPAPSQRLATLQAAKEAGLYVYVVVAPTYPESDEVDLRKTLQEVAKLDPVTVFHEPINVRANNVQRIEQQAAALGIRLRTDVFESTESWRKYAIGALKQVEGIAASVGLGDRLHLWPDSLLGSKACIKKQESPEEYEAWIKKWWGRVSEWPK